MRSNKIIEDKVTEVDIEENIEMIIMKEVGVGLEKDSLQIMLEGMTEVIAVDLDQVQELVLMEIGLDVISVESMIFAKDCLTWKIDKETEQNTMDV